MFSYCKLFSTGTQALVRPGSPNSSLSADDRATIVPICRAKAVVDATPNPYDKDALRFKVSNIFFSSSDSRFTGNSIFAISK